MQKRKPVSIVTTLIVFTGTAVLSTIATLPKGPEEWLIPLLTASVTTLTHFVLEIRHGLSYGLDGVEGQLNAMAAGVFVFVILVLLIK